MRVKAFIVPIVFVLIGIAITILGVLFKILHWGYGPINAPYLLAIGTLSVVIGIMTAVIPLIIHLFKKN